VAAHRLGGIVPVGAIFKASLRIGQIGHLRSKAAELRTAEQGLRVLP